MEPPTRVSGRANKGQNRKRALSTTSPTQGSKRTLKRPLKQALKKALNHQIRRPTEPLQQLLVLIFVKFSPLRSEQLEELEEEEEELEEELEEEEEELEKLEEQLEEEPEEELEELPISFISWWEAVYGREALPSVVSSKYNTTKLFYRLIKCWQDSIITKYLLQIFTINRLKATTSYKKQLKTDYFYYKISERYNLYKVIKLLKDLYK